MTDQLEPCPFCGGRPSIGLCGNRLMHDCKSLGAFISCTPEAWNTRYKRTCHIVIKPTDSDYRDGWHYLCSECGFPIEVGEVESFADGSTPIVLSHAAFCWHCGAEVADD